MIQPLDTSRNTWRLLWFDLEEPIPKTSTGSPGGTATEYYLPTCLLVTTAGGRPICPPEILEELDQPHAEELLGKLFDEHGTPERLSIAESGEWDAAAWRNFATDYHVEVSFGSFPAPQPGDLRQAARKIAQRLMGEDFHPPATVARGLVATARRLQSPERKAAHLRKAIEHDAACSEARIELADADYQSGRWSECRRGYLEVIGIEEKRWKGESPRWWSDPETRPYLRALYGRAMTEWQQGKFSITARELQRILELNPVDNQGVRFLIPMVHLLGDDDDAALTALNAYEEAYPGDYCEPSLLFGKALAAWRAGDEEAAAAIYGTAMLKNIYIAPLLLDVPLPPGDLWHPNDRSELSYAQDFIQSYATLWDRDPAALRFVRETHATLAEKLEQIVAHRRIMSEWQDQRYARDFKIRWKAMTDLDDILTGGPERESA